MKNPKPLTTPSLTLLIARASSTPSSIAVVLTPAGWITPQRSSICSARPASCEVTENRLYVKAVTDRLQREVKSRRVGDVVEAGVMISNSEVGLGSVLVTPFAHFLVCLNGMTREGGKRWNHLGRRADEKDDVYALLTDDS